MKPDKKALFFPDKLYLLVFAFAVASYLPEIIRYPGFIYTHTGLNPYLWLIVVLAILLASRLILRIQPNLRISALYCVYLVPGMLTLSILFHLVEHFWFENATYAYLRIQPATFSNLALYMSLGMLLFLGPKLIRDYSKRLVFVGAIIIFCLFVYLKWHFPQVFRYLDQEDSPLEYATFFFYLGAAWLSYKSFGLLKKSQVKRALGSFWRVLLITSCLGLVLVAGEEISWGQRILQIDTPETIRQFNKQEETNLHNTELIFTYVYDAYLILGFYGLLSWLAVYIPFKYRGFGLDAWFYPVLSGWYLSLYFAPIIGYVVWRYATMDGTYDPWEEATELILSLGVFAIYFQSYRQIMSNRFPRNTKKSSDI